MKAWGRSPAVIASLVFAAQLASAAHLVLVRHEVCPLDGELVHSDEAGAHHGSVHARNDRVPAFTLARESASHHGHEHCVLASQRRDRASLHDARIGLHAPDAILTCRSPDAGELPDRIAVHRLAPKQSPPA